MGVRIRSIEVQRLSIPMVRPIQMSFGTIGEQNLLLVRLTTEDGVLGVGEACVMGGPYWNHETIEGVHAIVTRYAAPHLIGKSFADLASFSDRLQVLFRGNGSARCALEMAFLDAQGKHLGQSAAQLLGGARRQSIPVAWTLSSRDPDLAIEDGETAIAQRGHRTFKVKVAVSDPNEELYFAAHICRHFQGRARLIIDANQAWSESTALELLPRFRDAGADAIEQPVAAHDMGAMARIVRTCGIQVIADEALSGPKSAATLSRERAASCFSLKPQRDGGLYDTLLTAAIASEGGISCYGGTMLETSLGTAAMCALYATVPELEWGSELFGPLRLAHDILATPIVPSGGSIAVPNGPGLGIVLDEDRVDYLVRQAQR